MITLTANTKNRGNGSTVAAQLQVVQRQFHLPFQLLTSCCLLLLRIQAFVGRQVTVPMSGGRTIPVIADDYVDMEFGTGALKITPGERQPGPGM